MRAYGWTIIVGALGQPIIYLLGLAVGLAALINAPIDDGGVEVSYLVFVAPALLMTATIAVASEEFTYPGDGRVQVAPLLLRLQRVADRRAGRSRTGVIFGAVGAHGRRRRRVHAVPLPLRRRPGVLVRLDHDPRRGAARGSSFGVPLMAYAASIYDDKGQFALVQRFIFMPMFLFSGTFYPLDSLPLWLQWIGWVSPLWHATELGRMDLVRRGAVAAR